MKLSVIIPAHNEVARIGAALEALCVQDYPDFEIIVVDNASTDSTVPAARAASQDAKIVFEARKGTMWACERGRKEASGDIIVRMDADCIPDRDWLRRGAEHFKKTDVAVVSGPYLYYDTSPGFRAISYLTQKYLYTFANLLLRLFRLGGITIGGNTFMRASALQAAGGFNTNLVFYGDDTDVAKRLSKYGLCIFDPHLVMRTSGRRFESHGTIRLAFAYWYHFFKQLFS